MSNALAIASVTAVLKDLLDNALIDRQVPNAVGGAVTVSALAPDRIKVGDEESAQLNLFLYHVAPNAGWRNVGLPSHDARGERVNNPPLALDLMYLLTAYARQDFEAEILLGYAMQLLHETPIITRDAIRRSLAPASPVGPGILPPALSALTATDLAEQIETIKIGLHPMSIEEMSKLWSALQAHYRPSVAYQVSVVLIESQRSTKVELPVCARNLYVVPLDQPRIDQVIGQNGTQQPILAGQAITILGHHLSAENAFVRIGEIEIAPDEMRDTQIILILPATLRAGVQSVQVIHRIAMGTPPTLHPGFESNVAAFVLGPKITDVTFATDELTITFDPPIGKTQRVIALLNEFNPPTTRPARAYSFTAPSRPANDPDTRASLTIRATDLMPGDYLVRVQVDGAVSPLDVNDAGQYASPQVTI